MARTAMRIGAVVLSLAATMTGSVSQATPAPAPSSASAEASHVWDVGQFSGEVSVPDSVRFHLPHRWIRAQSFTLRDSSGVWKRGVDFLLDPRRGTLRLLKPSPRDGKMQADYRYFPLLLPPEFRLHRPWVRPDSLATGVGHSTSAFGSLSAATGRGRRLPKNLEATRLQIAGSKTFSVEVGSQQELALKQSLDLSIRGRLGPDVNVKAVLTDRDTPLQPEGTSTQLQDFDRVLVEVEGPRAEMTLGDYELVLPTTEFSSYRRQLQGVRGEVDLGIGVLDAVGATSPGTFLSADFVGREGVQGPYDVDPNGGLGGQVIVAGSETVWLENQKLVRGESEDYIIDYSEGTVTFTGRHPITSYSRISIDYQLATEVYPRSVYSGGFRMGEESSFQARWLLERDDRNDPLGLELSEESKQRLRDAGDFDSDSLSSGIEFVGPGFGEYDRVSVDTLATPFYAYTGPDSGSYLIRFDSVGAENGDYADTTTAKGTYFVFVGEGEGDFLPGAAIERPESIGLFSARSSLQGRGVSLVTEIALSDFDANTFSSIDDGDNQGLAISVDAKKSGLSIQGGELVVGASIRRVDRKFRQVDRLEDTFYGLDWNATRDQLSEGEERLEGEAKWVRGTNRLSVDVGRLNNTADFSSERVAGEVHLNPKGLLLDLRLLRSQSDDESGGTSIPGARERDHAGLAWPTRWVKASVEYDHERSESGQGSSQSGSFYDQQSYRLATGSGLSKWTGLLSFQQRETHQISSGVESKTDRADTWLADLEWRLGGGRYLSTHYTRRNFVPSSGEGETTTDLGQVRWWTRHGPDGLIQQEGRWELSTSAERDRIRVIEFVGEGEGHYDSLGVFEGVGDYEVFFREQLDRNSKNRLDASFRTELDRTRGELAEDASPWDRLVGSVRLVHYWTSRIETDRSGSRLWSAMPKLLWGSAGAALVDVTHRGDLTALSGVRWFSPRLRYERHRTVRDDSGDLTDRASRDLWGVRLRSQPMSAWSVDLEQEWETDERGLERESIQSLSRTGWRSTTTILKNQFRWKGTVLRLEGKARRRDRIGADETAVVQSLAPGLVWNPRPRSRIELETERTWVDRKNGSSRASRELEQAGWNSRVVSTFRLRESLDLSFFLRERRPSGGTTVRDSRLELRATF